MRERIIAVATQIAELRVRMKALEKEMDQLLSGSVKPTRRKVKVNGKTISGKIIQALSGEPRMPYEKLTVVAYGKDTSKNRKKLRASLQALRAGKRVKRVGDGEWEVVET